MAYRSNPYAFIVVLTFCNTVIVYCDILEPFLPFSGGWGSGVGESLPMRAVYRSYYTTSDVVCMFVVVRLLVKSGICILHVYYIHVVKVSGHKIVHKYKSTLSNEEDYCR